MGAIRTPLEVAGGDEPFAAPRHPPARPRSVGKDAALRRLLAAGDAIAVILALVLAVAIPGAGAAGHQILWGVVAVPLIMLLFKLYGLYDRDVKRISYSTVDDLPWLFHATVIGALLLWVYARYSPMHRLDFAQILLFGINVIVLVTIVRFAVRSVAGRVIGSENALLVGTDEIGKTLVGKLAAHREYRLNVIGALSPSDASAGAESRIVPALGTLEQLEQVADRHDVSRVVFSARDIEERELERMLRDCRSLSLKVSVLPRLADVLGPAVEIDDVEGVTVLGVNPPWLPRSSRAIKRAMDLLVASTLLILAAPLLALLAVLIKLDSSGPVLFAQERVGRANRHFRLFKLRTMTVDAEQRRSDLLAQSTDPDWLKLDHDPRVTRIGHWLRRLSLDEVPQLWNVVRGEMSLVGPRPLIPAEDEHVQSWARRRLDLTPGITGYWQVLGRTRIPFEEMVKLDYLYVMNWSLWEDVRLMLRTLPVVIAGRGAN
ncbi:MAG: exopolysaccharide biosynthesis polyprenyl glycosylphosphotransferase [Solirubrobacteraceae bacterium]